MYTQRKTAKPDMRDAECPECKSKRLLYIRGSLQCTNCGHTVYANPRRNKYNATRTTANDGIKRDSKFEASVADELYMRKQAGDIKDYDSQYKIEAIAYTKDGEEAFKVSHKVDFRIHHNDNSFELLEAKGAITSDYQFRRKCLETLWLPLHKDHIYTVVKQNGRK